MPRCSFRRGRRTTRARRRCCRGSPNKTRWIIILLLPCPRAATPRPRRSVSLPPIRNGCLLANQGVGLRIDLADLLPKPSGSVDLRSARHPHRCASTPESHRVPRTRSAQNLRGRSGCPGPSQRLSLATGRPDLDSPRLPRRGCPGRSTNTLGEPDAVHAGRPFSLFGCFSTIPVSQACGSSIDLPASR